MLPDIKINAYVSSVGPFLEKPYQELDFSKQKVILYVVLMKKNQQYNGEYIREILSKEIQ
jgi:hypothetical protein